MLQVMFLSATSCLLTILVVVHAAPTVNLNDLATFESATSAADTQTRRKRSSYMPIMESPVPLVGEDVGGDVTADDRPEADLLTDDDWAYVGQVVQKLQIRRAMEREEAMAELQNDELEREIEELEAAEEAAEGDDDVMIIPENEQEAQLLASMAEPRYVVVDDGEDEAAAELAADPMITELADELAEEEELKDHINELASALRVRYN